MIQASADSRISNSLVDTSSAFDEYALNDFQYKIPSGWSFEQDEGWNVHCAPNGALGVIRITAIDISVMQITASNDEIFQNYINTSFGSDTDKPFVRDEKNGMPIATVSGLTKGSDGLLFQRVNITINDSEMLYALFVSDTDFAATDTACAYLDDFSTDITIQTE
jgi:hypothetical protein